MISFQTTHPDDIEFTANITMTLSAWRKLSDQLGEADHSWVHPAGDFRREIACVIRQAEQRFIPKAKEPQP